MDTKLVKAHYLNLIFEFRGYKVMIDTDFCVAEKVRWHGKIAGSRSA